MEHPLSSYLRYTRNPPQWDGFTGILFTPRRMDILMAAKAAFLILALACAASGFAGEDPAAQTAPSVSLHGFGTLGAARSSTDEAQFVRNLSQPEGLTRKWSAKVDSLVGLQANIRFDQQLHGVVQAVSRYRYDGSYSPEITWAFLRYDPDAAFSLRAGRLGTEFYMLADSRMVGYSYLTVRPQVDFYGTLPFTYIDGVDATATTHFARGLLRGKLFAGLSQEKAPWEELQFDMAGSPMVGGYLDYQQGPWQFRASHAQIRFNHDLPVENFYSALDAMVPNASDQLRVKDKLTWFSSLGLVYDNGPLQMHLMLSQTGNEHASFQDTRAGYLTTAYRFGRLTPYLGYSWAKSEPKNLTRPVPPVTDLYLAEFHTDQHTFFLGGRWDFHTNMALKAQVDWISGTQDSKFLYRWEPPTWSGHMSVYSLTLDFVF